jgi:putrescine transport system ATP-binding protein
MTMASRIAVMEFGRLCQIGTPGEVYEAPSSRFVADFIGAVNLLAGHVREASDSSLVIDAPAIGEFRVRGPALPPGAAVTVALRPEKIVLGRASAADGDNRHEGVVREIAYLGSLSLYRVELPSGALLRVSLPNTARLAGPSFARGERVHLSWPAEAAVVLPE